MREIRVIDKIEREDVIEEARTVVLWSFEVDSIENLHVFYYYCKRNWFVVIRETVIFSGKYAEQTFIDELRTERILVVIQGLVKR